MMDEKTRAIRSKQMQRPNDILAFLNEAKQNNGLFEFPVNSTVTTKQFEDVTVFLKHSMKNYDFLMLPNLFSSSNKLTPSKTKFFKELVVQNNKKSILLNVYVMFGLPKEHQNEESLNDIIAFFTLLNKYFLEHFDALNFELLYEKDPSRVVVDADIEGENNNEINKQFENLISNSVALTLWTQYIGEYLRKINVPSGFFITCDSTLNKKDFMRLLKEKY
jgi:hypothetical protein